MLNTRTDTADAQQQLSLARDAAEGEPAARHEVNQLVDEVIHFKTGQFCKRFCRDNHYRYRCTLRIPLGGAPGDASLCEWGNASYSWMLEDLTSSRRLAAYEARNNAGLFDYLYHIANSLPFYERWKDWRFGRSIHVPAYIKDLHPQAARVFLALHNGDEIPFIAQHCGLDEVQTESLCHQIIIELTRRRKLHLLTPHTQVSLSVSDDGEDSQQDIAVHDIPADEQQQHEQLASAWMQLDTVERFVLEAFIIEQQDAGDILACLKTMHIAIKQGVDPDDTNIQQLYYFKRKTLTRLQQLMDENIQNSPSTTSSLNIRE